MTYSFIKEEHIKDIYARCYLEECYMEANYFQLLFDDSTPSYEVNISEGRHKQGVPTSFPYNSSTMVVLLPQPPFCGYTVAILAMDGFIYLDPHD